MTIRIGIIGAGMIGAYHAERLVRELSGCEVTAVTDIDAARAEALASSIGAEAFSTGQSLIESDRVDAVLIASWGPTHEEYLLAAIAAGKPAFCEKPLATSEAACLNIMEAELAFGRRLVQVGFMRRFDADYRALKATLASGAIGAPLMFHAAHRNASVPAGLYTSDMPLNDTLVHDADIARWLLDDEVRAVEVRLPRRSRIGGELRDPVFVLLHMASGVLVDVEISVNIGYGYDIRGEISGETGVAALPERSGTALRAAGTWSGHIPADWRERFSAAYGVELREWLDAAAEGTATGPSTWDGYAATLVADAALRAVESGAAEPVPMRDKPALYAD